LDRPVLLSALDDNLAHQAGAVLLAVPLAERVVALDLHVDQIIGALDDDPTRGIVGEPALVVRRGFRALEHAPFRDVDLHVSCVFLEEMVDQLFVVEEVHGQGCVLEEFLVRVVQLADA